MTKKLRIISEKELKTILEKHLLWLESKEGGKRADLSNTNLKGVKLNNVNLYEVNLNGSDLSYSDLSNSNLRESNLSYSNLSFSNLGNTAFYQANLTEADLTGANLYGADLYMANLDNIKYDINSSLSTQCPESGSFIGYKKAQNGYIVKIEITEDSIRSSATTEKCRCSKAKVLSITNMNDTEKRNEIQSIKDNNFIYKVGEIANSTSFDNRRWLENTTGIHFFIKRENAVDYNF